MSNQTRMITSGRQTLSLAFPPTVARRVAEAGIEIKDLVRTPAARRGVRPHAADPLSRLERRRASSAAAPTCRSRQATPTAANRAAQRPGRADGHTPGRERPPAPSPASP